MKKGKEKRCLHCKRLITIPNYKLHMCPRCLEGGTKKAGAAGAATVGTAGIVYGGVKLAKEIRNIIKGK